MLIDAPSTQHTSASGPDEVVACGGVPGQQVD
jgi:hypothetical protein